MSYYDNYFESQRAEATSLGKWIVNWRNEWFVKTIVRYLDRDMGMTSILEIGPGKGDFADCVRAKTDWKYTCIEGNTKMAKKLSSRGLKVRHALVPPINLKQRFDIVYMNQVFEHMPNTTTAFDLIVEIEGLLNTGGLLVISCPEILFWKSDFFAGDYTHSNPTSFHNMSQIIQDSNLKPVLSTHYTLFFQGYFLTKLVSLLIRLADEIFLLDLFFGKKAYKIKTSILGSSLIIAKK